MPPDRPSPRTNCGAAAHGRQSPHSGSARTEHTPADPAPPSGPGACSVHCATSATHGTRAIDRVAASVVCRIEARGRKAVGTRSAAAVPRSRATPRSRALVCVTTGAAIDSAPAPSRPPAARGGVAGKRAAPAPACAWPSRAGTPGRFARAPCRADRRPGVFATPGAPRPHPVPGAALRRRLLASRGGRQPARRRWRTGAAGRTAQQGRQRGCRPAGRPVAAWRGTDRAALHRGIVDACVADETRGAGGTRRAHRAVRASRHLYAAADRGALVGARPPPARGAPLCPRAGGAFRADRTQPPVRAALGRRQGASRRASPRDRMVAAGVGRCGAG